MKVGLCLTGGGARGAYQIGVAKALEELGILQKVEVFSGTSIGSVNASMLATMSVDDAKDIWFSVSNDLLKRTENIFRRIIKEKLEFKNTGVFEITSLENMLKDHLNLDKLRQKEVYVTLSEGGEVNEGIFGLFKSSFHHYIKKDESHVVYSKISSYEDDDAIYKQILASCSIPIVFAPLQVDDKQYYDGGLYDNAPVKPLIEEGCDTIIVIHLEKIHFLNPSKYPGITFHEIKTKEHLGGHLNFDSDKSRKIFQYGYVEGIEYFKEHTL